MHKDVVKKRKEEEDEYWRHTIGNNAHIHIGYYLRIRRKRRVIYVTRRAKIGQNNYHLAQWLLCVR